MARIVIIADGDASKTALDRAISGWGHEALSTSDPLLGLELAVTFSPELVVVDCDAACMDAITVVRELHEVLQGECPAILLISAVDLHEIEAQLPATAMPAAVVPRQHEAGALREGVRWALGKRGHPRGLFAGAAIVPAAPVRGPAAAPAR